MKQGQSFFVILAIRLCSLCFSGTEAKAQPFTIQPVSGNRCAAVAGSVIRVSTENNVVSRTSTATSGSATLTSVTTTGLSVGMSVSGTGIQTNTIISAVGVNTVTMNKTATASGTASRDFFAPAISPQWLTGCGLTVSATGTGPGLNQYWADVQSAGTSDACGFCPSKVSFQWKVVSAGCTSAYLGANTASTVVYKSFTTAQLNTCSNAEGTGDFQIYTESPPCVGASQLVTLAVKPYNICNTDFTQSQNAGDIERDEVVWGLGGWTEVFRAADKTSITAITPSSIGTDTYVLTTRLGKCNTGYHASKPFNIQPSNSYITVSANAGAFTSRVDGSLDPVTGLGVPGSACLAANSTASFSLTANPAQITGAGYQWNIPEGFTCAGGCTTQTVTLTAQAGAAGGSGTVSCMVNNGQCGRTIAFFTINRNLVSGYNTISTVRTRPNPALPSAGDVATWPTTCYYPDLNYAFTLGLAPINNTYTWTPTTTPSPFWTNITGQGTVAFTANADVANANASPPSALGISVTGVGPALQSGQPICTLTVTNSGYLASSHVTNGLTVLKSGSLFSVVQASNNSTTWYNSTNFTCNSSTLGAGQFYYEWGYIGTYTPSGGSGLVNTAGNIVQANNVAAFATNPSQSGANGITQNSGTFSSGTVVYCRVRKNTTSPQCTGGDAARNCFYAVATVTIP